MNPTKNNYVFYEVVVLIVYYDIDNNSSESESYANQFLL
jgi:hypothetical protein